MFPGASRSDVLVATAGPVIGVLALIAGLATSDLTTALFGAVALLSGLLFAVPLYRRTHGLGGGDDDEL